MSSQPGNADGQAGRAVAGPDFRTLFEALPGAYCVLDPGLVIVGASDAYLRDTRTTRAAIVGRPITEIFPDRPDPGGPAALRASLDTVRAEQVADTMAVDRYDIPAEAAGGAPDVRYWGVINIPVPGQGDQLDWIIHTLDDVTGYIQASQDQARHPGSGRHGAGPHPADRGGPAGPVAGSAAGQPGAAGSQRIPAGRLRREEGIPRPAQPRVPHPAEHDPGLR